MTYLYGIGKGMSLSSIIRNMTMMLWGKKETAKAELKNNLVTCKQKHKIERPIGHTHSSGLLLWNTELTKKVNIAYVLTVSKSETPLTQRCEQRWSSAIYDSKNDVFQGVHSCKSSTLTICYGIAMSNIKICVFTREGFLGLSYLMYHPKHSKKNLGHWRSSNILSN